MFYDPQEFKFLHPFMLKSDSIIREFESARKNLPELKKFMKERNPEFYSHVDWWSRDTGVMTDPREGTWGAFPILKETFPVKWYDAKSTFPTVYSLLEQMEGFYSAFFFKLGGGSSILEHTHSIKNLVFHMCVSEANGPCYFYCDGQERIMSKKGEAIVFDYTKPHRSHNAGTKDRVCLTIDFKNPYA